MVNFLISVLVSIVIFYFFYKDLLREKDDEIYRWQEEYDEQFVRRKKLELEVSELRKEIDKSRKEIDTLRKVASNKWEHISAEEILDIFKKTFNKN